MEISRTAVDWTLWEERFVSCFHIQCMYWLYRELLRLTATTGLIKVVAGCRQQHFTLIGSCQIGGVCVESTDVPSTLTRTFRILSFVSRLNLDLELPVENYTHAKPNPPHYFLPLHIKDYTTKTKKSPEIKGGIVQTFRGKAAVGSSRANDTKDPFIPTHLQSWGLCNKPQD